MSTLTYPQLEALWEQAGGAASLAPTMAAIAEAESGGNTTALNNNPATGDYSVGPWQINYYGKVLGPARTKEFGPPSALLANPLLDAKAAVSLAGSGTGLPNWSTFNSGAYLSYLPAGSLPSPAAQASLDSALTTSGSSTSKLPGFGMLVVLDNLLNPSLPGVLKDITTLGAAPLGVEVEKLVFRGLFAIAGIGLFAVGAAGVLLSTLGIGVAKASGSAFVEGAGVSEAASVLGRHAARAAARRAAS